MTSNVSLKRYSEKSAQINSIFLKPERFSFALRMVLGEISIPDNLRKNSATFAAILPVPIPISRTLFAGVSSRESRKDCPFHLSMYSLNG